MYKQHSPKVRLLCVRNLPQLDQFLIFQSFGQCLWKQNFSEVIQSRASLLFKIPVSEIIISFVQARAVYRSKVAGEKIVPVIGLAEIKGIFGCNSAKLWYIASFIPQKRGPLVFTLSDVAAQYQSLFFWISEQLSVVTQNKGKYGNSNVVWWQFGDRVRWGSSWIPTNIQHPSSAFFCAVWSTNQNGKGCFQRVMANWDRSLEVRSRQKEALCRFGVRLFLFMMPVSLKGSRNQSAGKNLWCRERSLFFSSSIPSSWGFIFICPQMGVNWGFHLTLHLLTANS